MILYPLTNAVLNAFNTKGGGGPLDSRLFYVPEDSDYTIVDSATDSIRFTVDKTLAECDCGHIASISSFVDAEGKAMSWHDFGHLEGPGWAGNAVGGAYEIFRWGVFLGRMEWQSTALAVLDHVLEHGFIDYETGFIHGYREIPTGTLCLNYQHNADWFCPGSMAKIAFQLLSFADVLGSDPRAERMRQAAVRCAAWIDRRLEPVSNGWFPRRCTPDGALHIGCRDDQDVSLWQGSADGLFIVQLQAALTMRGMADYAQSLAQRVETFVAAGGIFGSINHDTYDAYENVAYAVAFRTLHLVSQVLGDAGLDRFGHDMCLSGLDRFKMCEDRNGVKTRGLLYMEDSWDTAYLWENAEAALAYFEAAAAMRSGSPEDSHRYELDGLVILRAIARHHHGSHGFLTEGVDWNNHVGEQHHIDRTHYGAIRYTEPFLNNQHIAEPTLYYLEHLAAKECNGAEERWHDSEGNVILRRSV